MDTTQVTAADLQRQLFCYAEDLQTLIAQHHTLRQQHQTVQQALGHANLHRDLLLSSLLEKQIPYLVTNAQGQMTEVNAPAQALLGEAGAYWRGLSIEQLAPFNQRASLTALLDTLRTAHYAAAMVLHQLDLFDGREFDSIGRFDVLLVPLKTYAQLEFFWLLHPHESGVDDELGVLQQFDLLSDKRHGILMTQADAAILACNQTLTDITGYTSAELAGHTPKLFSSGRHAPEFYEQIKAELSATGSWSGEVFNRRKNGQIYPSWETIKTIKNSAGDTLAFLSLAADSSYPGRHDTDQLAQLAYHDALTGLPNRRMLEDRLRMSLSQAARDGSGFSLLFIDLDRFKPINDTLGHEVGDLVLQEVAKRLRQSVRQGDTAARIGGDEFVILLQSASVRRDIESIADTLLTRLGAPIEAGEHRLLVGASMGCARYPHDSADIDALLDHADSAMYAAKRFGGNHFCFYEPGGDARPVANLGADLWQALTRKELYLLYQPQVSAAGELRGCEALLRWNHPSAGLLEPLIFISIAEANGAIIPIGDWVLEQACSQLVQWHKANLPHLTLSVNVSIRQLQDADFPLRVRQTLERHGLAAADLELELTESEALQAPQDGRKGLQALRALGVKLAIDDFGSGYASLSRLKNMPVDRLKIDPSFVRDLATSSAAQAVSQCLVSMGRAMGMEVLAEGVETTEQHQLLTAQGCHLIQGYLTGHPTPADEFLSRFATP